MERGRDYLVVLEYELAKFSAAKEGPMELICIVLEWLGFAWELVIGTAQVVEACRDLRDRSNSDFWN